MHARGRGRRQNSGGGRYGWKMMGGKLVDLTYSPLLPLALLLFTGLYLFALPYAIKWRPKRGR